MTDENLDKIAESGIYNERGLRAVKVQNHEEEMLLMFTTGIDEKMHTVTNEDVFASFNYLLNLMDGHGTGDDIDHLGNRRVRCVGELLQNQFRIGLSRMERVVKERMTIQDNEVITPQARSTSVLLLPLLRNSSAAASCPSSWTRITLWQS